MTGAAAPPSHPHRSTRAARRLELQEALRDAKEVDRTVLIAVEVDRYEGVPSYESWWDVAVAEVSALSSVRAAREQYV